MDTPARRDVGLAVGLDIGGTKILGVLLGPDGVVQGSLRLPTTRGVTGVVVTAASVVRALTDEAGIVPGNLAGVGVGVLGSSTRPYPGQTMTRTERPTATMAFFLPRRRAMRR